jgi:phosphohistidine phosphatase
MKLCLIRHGHAVSETFDVERPLSGIGLAQAERLGALLQKENVSFDRIWHSPKLRARQTAEKIAEALNQNSILDEADGLKPDDAVEPIVDRIRLMAVEAPDTRLLIVSHVPFLPNLVSFLIGSDSPARVPVFPEAGAAFLTGGPKGLWEIRWIAGPDTRKIQIAG